MNVKRYLHIKAYFRVMRKYIILIIESIKERRDRTLLKREFVQLRDFDKWATDVHRELLPYYEEYISEVSTDIQAISLELSVFLRVLCNIIKPKSILDLGSGFSSFVFRLHMLNTAPKPVVWSVDDSEEWLERTRAFLGAHGMPNDKVITWRSFSEKDYGQFDLILHDLGNMELRMETLKHVLTLVRCGGVIVLDDTHFREYRSYTMPVLAESNFKYYNLKSFTEDRFGRYSMLVTRQLKNLLCH